jgi:hypothetical protein
MRKQMQSTDLTDYSDGLRDLVLNWDPMEFVSMGCPRDEYDCMVSPLVGLLCRGASTAQIAAFIRAHLTEHMGAHHVRDADEFAEKAWT